MIGDHVITATITSAIKSWWREELKQINPVVIGSQYSAGVVVRCLRSGSITASGIGTVIAAIWSFLKMGNDTHKQIEDALNAIGAVIEISRFMLIKMQEEGYTYDEAFSTAQEYIFKSLKI